LDANRALDAERAIAWRAADSFALREFLGLVLPEAPLDRSTISRARQRIESRSSTLRLERRAPLLLHANQVLVRAHDLRACSEVASACEAL
jgi:hypothetical protein